MCMQNKPPIVPNKFHYFLQQVIPSSHQRTQFLHWCALAYQRKMNPRKALWFYGGSGSGKSTLAQLMMEVFGENGVHQPIINHFEDNLHAYIGKTYTYFEHPNQDWRKVLGLLEDKIMVKRPLQNSMLEPCSIHPIIIERDKRLENFQTIPIHFHRPKYPKATILEELKTEVPAIRKYLLAVHPFQVGDLVYVLGRAPAILLKINHRNYQIRYLRDSYRVRHHLPNGRIYHMNDILKVKCIAHIPTNPKYAVSPSERVMYYQLKAVMK